MTLHSELARALWGKLAECPADVETLSLEACRALLAWNDVNAEFGESAADTCRAALYRQLMSDAIIEAYDAIRADRAARGLDNGGESDELRCIAAARTAGHPDAAECEAWRDDLVARCGVPQELADDLLAAIEDDFPLFNR